MSSYFFNILHKVTRNIATLYVCDAESIAGYTLVRFKSQISGSKPLSHQRKEETGKNILWAVRIYKNESPGHVCDLKYLQSGKHLLFFKVESD